MKGFCSGMNLLAAVFVFALLIVPTIALALGLGTFLKTLMDGWGFVFYKAKDWDTTT